jgi:orotidine-5'-phosphate decarboxylase
MGYKEFSAWFLSGAVSILVIVLGYFGSQSLDELKSIRHEVTQLNLTMVSVVTNQTNQQTQIDELKQRVLKLEGKE